MYKQPHVSTIWRLVVLKLVMNQLTDADSYVHYRLIRTSVHHDYDVVDKHNRFTVAMQASMNVELERKPVMVFQAL